MTQPLTIYVIQHAHTDIGYTHPQDVILQMYLDHYDRVLELCAQTADAPEGERFKWTCETSWQVRHYLESRPERVAEFVRYARNGQIDITANYLHYMDLIDPEALRRSLDWILAFCAEHDLPLKTALHSDVNGWSWALPDILADAGVKYFASQVHIDSATDPLGKRGSTHYHWLLEAPNAFRPDTPVRVPQAFWWEGAQGGRVLHWLNEHYLLGNSLGLSGYKLFGGDKTRYFTESDRLTVDDLFERASRELPRYIERVQAAGYALPIMLLSTGGFYVDNSPPDDRWLEVLRRLNDSLDGIQLRTSTLTEWFEALERLPGQWPSHQVAWPDHWSHGLGSSTARVAQARRTQRRRAAVTELVEKSGEDSALDALERAREQERLSLEHTFTAWSSEARPGSANISHQTAAKELTFHRAELFLDEAAGTALRAVTEPSPDAAQLYYPAADTPRTLHFDAGDEILDPSTQELKDADGHTVHFQREHEQLPFYVGIAPATTSLGALQLVPREEASPPVPPSDGLELANDYWSLRVDPRTGGLESLRDGSGREWAEPGFGRLVHTAVIHPSGRHAVHNIARFVQLGIAGPDALALMTDDPVIEESEPSLEAPEFSAGPVYDEISIRGQGERIGRVRFGWRAYHESDVVELVIDWDKVWSDLPEAGYVAFPFAADGLQLETSGGMFTPGSHEAGGQLPGTCSSYYTVQRAARITAGADGLLWLPVDAPLVMTNELDYNRWESDPYTWNGFLASMPVNHFWFTNFPTSQRGPLRLRYRFAPMGQDLEASIGAAQPLDAFGWR